MDDDELQRARCERAQELVEQLVREVDPGVLVTRFVVLAEVVEGDSRTRPVWVFAAPDANPQDSIGLLEHARDMERAATTAQWLEG